jgi:four helix bundle protein
MQSYRELEVYQLAHTLAVEVHRMTLTELPGFEMYEEGSQIRRSAKAVCSAVVEGFGRKRYQQEFVRYLTYAIASCDETKEHLELLFETGSLKHREQYASLLDRYEELGRKLYRFRETVRDGLERAASSLKSAACGLQPVAEVDR